MVGDRRVPLTSPRPSARAPLASGTSCSARRSTRPACRALKTLGVLPRAAEDAARRDPRLVRDVYDRAAPTVARAASAILASAESIQGALRGAARGSCRSCSSSSGRDRGAGGSWNSTRTSRAATASARSSSSLRPRAGARDSSSRHRACSLRRSRPLLRLARASPCSRKQVPRRTHRPTPQLRAATGSRADPARPRARREESAVDRLARSLRRGRGTLSLAGGGAVRLEVGPGETEDERLEARHALTSISFDAARERSSPGGVTSGRDWTSAPPRDSPPSRGRCLRAPHRERRTEDSSFRPARGSSSLS